MGYAPDPAGVFASDVHRRVMANVPNPDDQPLEVDELVERIAGDDFLDVDEGELEDVLKDLEADGHVSQSKSGWRNTAAGYEALSNDKANQKAEEEGA